MWLLGVSRGDTWLFLLDLVEVRDVGACVVRLWSHVVAPVYRELRCLGRCVPRVCFHVVLPWPDLGGGSWRYSIRFCMCLTPLVLRESFLAALAGRDSQSQEFIAGRLWWRSVGSGVTFGVPGGGPGGRVVTVVASFPAGSECEMQESVAVVAECACCERDCCFRSCYEWVRFWPKARLASISIDVDVVSASTLWMPTLSPASSDVDANFSDLHALQSPEFREQATPTIGELSPTSIKEGFPDLALVSTSVKNLEEGVFGGFLGLPKESFTAILDPFGVFFRGKQELGVNALDVKIPGMRPAIWPSTPGTARDRRQVLQDRTLAPANYCSKELTGVEEEASPTLSWSHLHPRTRSEAFLGASWDSPRRASLSPRPELGVNALDAEIPGVRLAILPSTPGTARDRRQVRLDRTVNFGIFARAKQMLVCRVVPLVEYCDTCLWLFPALGWLVANSGEVLPEFFSVGSGGELLVVVLNGTLVVLVEVLPEPVVLLPLSAVFSLSASTWVLPVKDREVGFISRTLWALPDGGLVSAMGVWLVAAACPVFSVRQHRFSVVWLACASIVPEWCLVLCASKSQYDGCTLEATGSLRDLLMWVSGGESLSVGLELFQVVGAVVYCTWSVVLPVSRVVSAVGATALHLVEFWCLWLHPLLVLEWLVFRAVWSPGALGCTMSGSWQPYQWYAGLGSWPVSRLKALAGFPFPFLSLSRFPPLCGGNLSPLRRLELGGVGGSCGARERRHGLRRRQPWHRVGPFVGWFFVLRVVVATPGCSIPVVRLPADVAIAEHVATSEKASPYSVVVTYFPVATGCLSQAGMPSGPSGRNAAGCLPVFTDRRQESAAGELEEWTVCPPLSCVWRWLDCSCCDVASHVGSEIGFLVALVYTVVAPNCCFGNPFLGAVCGGTAGCSSLTSWHVRVLLIWLHGVSRGDTWLFLPDLMEVRDVGACVVRLWAHVVAPVFRDLRCLGRCVPRVCFRVVLLWPDLGGGCFALLLWLVRDWLSLLSLVLEAHPPTLFRSVGGGATFGVPSGGLGVAKREKLVLEGGGQLAIDEQMVVILNTWR
ncbi:hypothetical protein Taro_001161 [Colocasia esculenta]|uniref:Uncharacterized protein n=1 Tax=Colocasia esculenta TaxID=4460 RepID=A0A843TCT9_COLES|nr:hypothetical protein [Colocasia esculenta]